MPTVDKAQSMGAKIESPPQGIQLGRDPTGVIFRTSPLVIAKVVRMCRILPASVIPNLIEARKMHACR